MKDPAFLFYTGDFSTGTQFFTDEQLGKYMRLLMAQHQHGHLDENQVLFICKSYDCVVMKKFIKDDVGLYYNTRLELEINKRKSYSESRGKNKLGKSKTKKIIPKSYDFHMEDKNENINNIILAYNTITNSKIKVTETRKGQINARLKEGYKLEDFKTVFTSKFNEWKNDPVMKKYIDPETLLGNKFTKYFEGANKKTENYVKNNTPKPSHYTNPKAYYETCVERKVVPVQYATEKTLTSQEIAAEHLKFNVGIYA